MTDSIIPLHDTTTGATAKIVPARGFNCISYQPIVDGQAVEVLWTDPQFVTGQAKASHSGVPLMFPFAGRLRGTSYRYRGKTYTLEAGDGIGNAIHGFVIDRPWRIVDQTGTRVVGQFQASVDEPALLELWPGDFRITLAYELIGHALVTDVRIENPGGEPLPFNFGTHPYFRVPLGAGKDAADCVVTVPAAEYWELVNMIPTGRKLPATGARGLAGGMRFADTKLDDVFTNLSFANGRTAVTIEDPQNRRTLEMTFDEQFRECIVYNPPHREAICLEPYVCAPDMFALEEQGINTGMRVLAPDETFATRIDIRLRS